MFHACTHNFHVFVLDFKHCYSALKSRSLAVDHQNNARPHATRQFASDATHCPPRLRVRDTARARRRTVECSRTYDYMSVPPAGLATEWTGGGRFFIHRPPPLKFLIFISPYRHHLRYLNLGVILRHGIPHLDDFFS